MASGTYAASQQREVELFPRVLLYVGTGSPEGVIAAPLGAMYVNKAGGAGTTLYLKELNDGLATGWAGV